MKLRRDFGVATGQSRYPDPARQVPDRRQVAQPVVVSAASDWAEGRGADPARPGQPARHALDGPLGAGRRHPRHPRSRFDRLLRLARLHPHADSRGRVALQRRSTSARRSTSCNERAVAPRRPGRRRGGRGGPPRPARLEARAGRERGHLGAQARRHPARAGVHARAPQRRGRPFVRLAARQDHRPELLGLVVRAVPRRDASAPARARSGGRGRTSSSSASTRRTCAATRRLPRPLRRHLSQRLRRQGIDDRALRRHRLPGDVLHRRGRQRSLPHRRAGREAADIDDGIERALAPA